MSVMFLLKKQRSIWCSRSAINRLPVRWVVMATALHIQP